MVRKGSPVRVRQRALENLRMPGFSCPRDSHARGVTPLQGPRRSRRSRRLWSAQVAGEAPRILERPVDLFEIHGVVEVVLLGGAGALDVEVVHDEQLLVGVRGL